MRTSLLCLWIGTTTILSGCGGGSSADADRVSTIAALSGDAASGKSVYEANCVDCHGANGRAGSASVDVASSAKNNANGAISQILEGGGGMQAFDSLADQEIADVVAYLSGL